LTNRVITIGTRGSALALVQAEGVKDRLERRHPGLVVNLEVIKTKGDKILDVPLAQVGGKGLFVKEIEEALLEGRVDLAVHSMKDVPTDIPPALSIAAITEREDFRDALVNGTGVGLSALPPGARIGTSSLRRRAQLLHWRPDLEIVPLRGNLDTRLKKLTTDHLDGVILAAAGLSRMNLSHQASQFLEPELMLPAIGQGALGLEVRRDDQEILDRIAFLHHRPTAVCVTGERAFLKRLEGGCQLPVAALGRLEGERLTLTGLVADSDGRRYFRDSLETPAQEAEAAGRELAERILAQGGSLVLAEIYGRTV